MEDEVWQWQAWQRVTIGPLVSRNNDEWSCRGTSVDDRK